MVCGQHKNIRLRPLGRFGGNAAHSVEEGFTAGDGMNPVIALSSESMFISG